MAIEKVENVKVNTDEAVEEVDKLNESIEEVGDESVSTAKKIDRVNDQVTDGTKKASKGITGLSKTFKRLGTVIKGLGIGALLAVFAAFSKVAGESQSALDGMATAMTVVQLLVQDMGNGFERFAEADSIGSYFRGITDQAKALTESLKGATLAQAVLNRTVAQAELDAEKQRQTRDDITANFETRIEASTKLGEIIKTQSEDTLALAESNLLAAEAQRTANNNVENAVRVIEAQTAVLDAKNQVATAESEQLVSHNAIVKESAEAILEEDRAVKE